MAIVVAYDDPTAEQDLNVYRAYFGLPNCTSSTPNPCFQKVSGRGKDKPLPKEPPPEGDWWSIEASIDLDAVSVMCPRCKLVLVEADDAQDENLFQAIDVAAETGAKIISSSWGGAEDKDKQASLDQRYLSRPGVSMLFAGGDNGYGTSYPATSRNVWAVGGTKLALGSDAGWRESVWNDGTAASGSGCSAFEPKPAWQESLNTGCKMRLANDVSANAEGLAVYSQGGWMFGSGTSLATALVAGILAVTGHAGAGPAFAYSTPGRAIFHDIVDGNNVLPGVSVGCAPPNVLCTAQKGYDGPSGWGAPSWNGASSAHP